MMVGPVLMSGLAFVLSLDDPVQAGVRSGDDVNAPASADLVDFDTDVMPILTKAGCNVGACHGAAAGRGEFFLSLYGSRPQADYEQITRFFQGRRISRTEPESSLMLKKATEQVSHEGGARVEYDSADHATLIRWIRQGARRQNVRRLTEFQLSVEKDHVTVGESTQISAGACFNDGSRRDVFPWTVLSADDPSAVTVAADGRVTILRSGRHVLTGRYMDRVMTVEIMAPWGLPIAPRANAASPVDQFVDRRLAQLQIPSGPRADDEVLLRRLYLDVTGRLPTDRDRADFFRQPETSRVETLINRLTETGDQPTAFDGYWTWVIAQQLQLGAVARGKQGREAIYNWLQEAIRRDEGYDQIVRSMLTATGKISEVPPAAFYQVAPGPGPTAELVSRAFLGVRLQCANCHDHPLDHWKQEDYHGLSAIFAGLRVGESVKVGSGSVVNPATGEPAVSLIPGGDPVSHAADPRLPLADWLSGSDNQLFARAFVNRIWARLMGRGLVEPVDDLRDTNPATHPQLLDWLARDFQASGYRLRHLVRTICRTDVYQRAAATSVSTPPQLAFYPGALPKKMAPEVYLDAIGTVLGVPRPVQVSYRGLAARQNGQAALSGCQGPECETLTLASSNLAVQLSLLNGRPLNELLEESRLHDLADGTPDEVVSRLYRRALGRLPTAGESAFWVPQLAGRRAEADVTVDLFALQDFAWSLLTSAEFLTSH
ncbi:MAG: DUF1549 and DUF1553 domain-containing protein [Planctomycetaceae bacterium]|nr:DUF1549 and DUF1553 domain-containing protein [Planctomycetaceae bacterium]